MRWLRILGFQVRQFVAVPYFIQLMVLATLGTAVVQFVAWRAFDALDPQVAWTRAGAIGLWTTCTAAAGILGFERFKGTLVHLVLSPLGALRTSALVVMAAFPLAWLSWALMSWSVDFDFATPGRLGLVLGGAAGMWLGAVAMSLVIATLFVLTPNAITYEGLLLTPIFLLSGLMFSTSAAPGWVAVASRLLPLSWPLDLLFGRPDATLTAFLTWLACLASWLGIAAWAGHLALRRATELGTLEVI